MPDSSAVDEALSAKLLADATLRSLMPGGVYFDFTKAGVTQAVVISQLAHEDAYQFQGSAWERFVYLVKAVEQSSTGSNVRTAAARIHTLLQDGTLSAAGYGLMVMQRLERVRYTEVDQDSDARWQHRGGQYEVLVQPL
jgi:hypothetical protein